MVAILEIDLKALFFRVMKIVFTLLTCWITVCSYAQKNYMLLRTAGTGDMTFPFFSCQEDTLTAQKINTTLQLYVLNLVKGHEHKNIFEQVTSNDDGLYGAKTNISFDVSANNNRILSVSFDEAASGMTTHYWQSYFNFNARNGELLRLNDLFTPAGYKTFTAMIIRKRQQDFDHDKRTKKLGQEVYDNNKSCFTEISNDWFYIAHDTLFIDGQNCLPKANMFDEISLQHSFSFAQLQPLLNAYGKAIFTPGADLSGFHSQPDMQLMRGLINEKYPVLFFIINKDNENTTALYAYEKTGIGIPLTGTCQNGKLVLTEQDEKGNDRAAIAATVAGDSITGTWTDKKQHKTYSFRVKKW